MWLVFYELSQVHYVVLLIYVDHIEDKRDTTVSTHSGEPHYC